MVHTLQRAEYALPGKLAKIRDSKATIETSYPHIQMSGAPQIPQSWGQRIYCQGPGNYTVSVHPQPFIIISKHTAATTYSIAVR